MEKFIQKFKNRNEKYLKVEKVKIKYLKFYE